ncbi:MAG: hypothetical protein ACI8RP_000628 [Urechidicola sp.]|jgi:hypothetical protein
MKLIIGAIIKNFSFVHFYITTKFQKVNNRKLVVRKNIFRIKNKKHVKEIRV